MPSRVGYGLAQLTLLGDPGFTGQVDRPGEIRIAPGLSLASCFNPPILESFNMQGLCTVD